jgi:hypothetical protein
MWRLLIIFPQNMAKFAKEIPKRLFVALAREFYCCLHSPKKNPIRVCQLLGFLVQLLGFGIWNTNRETRKREREKRGHDILDDQFCYSLEAASWTSFLPRSCERALYNSESAKRIFGWCFGFFFFFWYQSGSVGKH